MELLHVTSRDNPLLARVRKLSSDGGAYRKLGQVWLEGDHLCRAAVEHGHEPLHAVLTEAAWQNPALRALAEAAPRVALVPEALLRAASGLESPAPIGFIVPLAAPPAIRPDAATVVLDRLQDAGNVGSIIRSAAALGVVQVLALKGSAALWSPKVLRAGMGAHFGLALIEGLEAQALGALQVPLVATSTQATAQLHEVELPSPCAWVFGHEGRGIEAALLRRCALAVRIPQPGGEESLNVAAAAAICCYESLRQARCQPASR